MADNTQELEEILQKFAMAEQQIGDEMAVGAIQEEDFDVRDTLAREQAEQAILDWHNKQIEKRERETNDAGHFFVEKKMRGGAIDYGYYWFCKCGYKANGKDELDGHIKWQLAQLQEEQSDIR